MKVHRSPTATILGIDPGYDRVGWCIGLAQGGQFTPQLYGCIETNKKESLIERYRQIDRELQEIVEKHKPQEAALESIFFSKNQKTAMHVSEARGIILSVLLRYRLEIFEYTPNQIKQSVTGYGSADKAAVEKMLRLQFTLRNEKILDDVMDAIGVAVTHAAQRGILKI